MISFSEEYLKDYCSYFKIVFNDRNVAVYYDDELNSSVAVSIRRFPKGIAIGLKKDWLYKKQIIEQKIDINSTDEEILEVIQEENYKYSYKVIEGTQFTVDKASIIAPKIDGYGRLLSVKDKELSEEFFKNCSERDKESGAVSVEDPVAGGIFTEDGRLAAISSIWHWGNIDDYGVLTREDLRGQGFGAAAVALMVQDTINRGKIPQYRCANQNEKSYKLAKKVGFDEVLKVKWFKIIS